MRPYRKTMKTLIAIITFMQMLQLFGQSNTSFQIKIPLQIVEERRRMMETDSFFNSLILCDTLETRCIHAKTVRTIPVINCRLLYENDSTWRICLPDTVPYYAFMLRKIRKHYPITHIYSIDHQNTRITPLDIQSSELDWLYGLNEQTVDMMPSLHDERCAILYDSGLQMVFFIKDGEAYAYRNKASKWKRTRKGVRVKFYHQRELRKVSTILSNPFPILEAYLQERRLKFKK